MIFLDTALKERGDSKEDRAILSYQIRTVELNRKRNDLMRFREKKGKSRLEIQMIRVRV